MISVDGDTSTNDTVLVLANGMAENDIITEDSKDYQTFYDALFYVLRELSKKIAGDGEGCTCLFEVHQSSHLRTRCKLGQNPLCNGLFRCGLRTGKSRYLL